MCFLKRSHFIDNHLTSHGFIHCVIALRRCWEIPGKIAPFIFFFPLFFFEKPFFLLQRINQIGKRSFQSYRRIVAVFSYFFSLLVFRFLFIQSSVGVFENLFMHSCSRPHPTPHLALISPLIPHSFAFHCKHNNFCSVFHCTIFSIFVSINVIQHQ